VAFTDVWPLAALACLSFPERPRRPPVDTRGDSGATRFAHAVGLSAIVGGDAPNQHQRDRTVPLRRVATRAEIEPAAAAMSSLVVSDDQNQDVRLAVKYVLVELLRNAVQHSGDTLGAVVCAQRMDKAQRRSRPMIQLVVVDAGVGIPAHLKRTHPHLGDYRQALERALLPHISGTFEEGLSGSHENAGLGLYMISELARQTGGRLLIATTGATLVLEPGAPAGVGVPRFLEPRGMGFPGTLVAFEIPSDTIEDYQLLMRAILQKAQERSPKRATGRWLKFDPAPEGAVHVAVAHAEEDTLAAATISAQDIVPSIQNKQAVELSFEGLELCTQSWLHALLYEAVRIAWAMRVPIHVVGAEPAVQEGLRFLEAYALGG
jgi:anti-sigma regulatory factor (Ser/Thr protein kinase)